MHLVYNTVGNRLSEDLLQKLHQNRLLAPSVYRPHCHLYGALAQLKAASAGINKIALAADVSGRLTIYSDKERGAGAADHSASVLMAESSGDNVKAIIFKAHRLDLRI